MSTAIKVKFNGEMSDCDEDKLRQNILQTMTRSDVNMTDVLGLKDAKSCANLFIQMNKIQEIIREEDWDPSFQNILFYGVTGTGKTLLAKAICGQLGTFFNVMPSDITAKFKGKDIKILFEEAIKKSPSVIFFDDAEWLQEKLQSKEELLRQMDRVESGSVIVIAATNNPQDLDPAFMKRFKPVYIPLPDYQSRMEMLHKRFSGPAYKLNEEDYKSLGRLTEGFSGADIEQLSGRVKRKKIYHMISNAEYFKKAGRIGGKQMYAPCQRNSDGAIKLNWAELPQDSVMLPNMKIYLDDVKIALKKPVIPMDSNTLKEMEKFGRKMGQIQETEIEIPPPKNPSISDIIIDLFSCM